MTASAHRPATFPRCVIAGGSGAVGQMIADFLRAQGTTVIIADPALTGPGGDITSPSSKLRADLAQADLVVLAVPEPVALRAIAEVAAQCDPGAVIVDTTSVKSRITPLLQSALGDRQAVSINPMFAPSLGLAGGSIAAVVGRDGPGVRELLELLSRTGAKVVTMTADEHDRLSAVTQALTHASILAFGLALLDLDGEKDAAAMIAPPPHVTMLAMLSRMSAAAPEVYWDVQEANPHSAAARAALDRAVTFINDMVRTGDAGAFTQMLHNFGSQLGERSESYREMCSDLFGLVLRRDLHLPGVK